MKKNIANIVNIIGFVIGIALFVWVLYVANVSEVIALFRGLPVWAFAVLLFYPLTCIWDVWGWKVIFDAAVSRAMRIRDLFVIRLIGSSFDDITPFADLGGEYVKARMCHQHLGVPERTAWTTVIVERTALFISEIVFWCLGLIPLFVATSVDIELKKGLLITALVAGGIAALLFIAQRMGLFNFILPEVKTFYAAHHKPWLVSVGLHLIGWLAGGVEMYLMMRAFNADVLFWHAMVLEALLHLVRTASFFIPASLGAQEGALALIITGFGYPPSLGVGVSLFKRARQMLWMCLGFGLWFRRFKFFTIP